MAKSDDHDVSLIADVVMSRDDDDNDGDDNVVIDNETEYVTESVDHHHIGQDEDDQELTSCEQVAKELPWRDP